MMVFTTTSQRTEWNKMLQICVTARKLFCAGIQETEAQTTQEDVIQETQADACQEIRVDVALAMLTGPVG